MSKTIDQLLDQARVELIDLQNRKRQAENRAALYKNQAENSRELVNVWFGTVIACFVVVFTCAFVI